MIKPMLKLDSKAQVGEKIRFTGFQSFITPNEPAISKVEFQADAAEPWITVGDPLDKTTWFMDWVYTSVGNKVPSIRITSGTLPGVTATESGAIEIVLAADEKLFCSDESLLPQESDIILWLPEGRSTWNFIHRRVQQRIMEEIDKQRIFNVDGSKITLDQVLDVSQFRDWAIYMALAMIFQSISRSVDDIASEKMKYYESKQFEYMNFCMNLMRVDTNKDGVLTQEDEKGFRSTVMVKR